MSSVAPSLLSMGIPYLSFFVEAMWLLLVTCKLGAGVDIEEIFTTDEKESCIRVTPWGFLGDTWPFFRPNFTNMEQERAQAGVDEVRSLAWTIPCTGHVICFVVSQSTHAQQALS